MALAGVMKDGKTLIQEFVNGDRIALTKSNGDLVSGVLVSHGSGRVTIREGTDGERAYEESGIKQSFRSDFGTRGLLKRGPRDDGYLVVGGAA